MPCPFVPRPMPGMVSRVRLAVCMPLVCMPDMVPVERMSLMLALRALPVLAVFRVLAMLVLGMAALRMMRMAPKELFCRPLVLVIMLHSAPLNCICNVDAPGDSCRPMGTVSLLG